MAAPSLTPRRSLSILDLGSLLYLGAVWGAVFLFMRVAAPQVGPVWAADIRLLIGAVVLLAIPIVALLLVGTYAKDEPRLGGFPFFIWYQFLWVFICSAMTWTAYKLTLAARKGDRK